MWGLDLSLASFLMGIIDLLGLVYAMRGVGGAGSFGGGGGGGGGGGDGDGDVVGIEVRVYALVCVAELMFWNRPQEVK